MAYAIGIMQGRLSRPVQNRIQAFPSQTWEQEFKTASQIGLAAIEWIFEEPYAENPLWSPAGREEIKKHTAETGVRVDHVCADYFMEHPFFRVSAAEGQQSSAILKELIPFCREIGAKSVELPFLDNSRIDSQEEMDATVRAMRAALPVAQEEKLAIALETSLAAPAFRKLLEDMDHPLVKAVYDIGNSASLGYDTSEEIAALGKYLSNVHIKDRLLGAGTVPLGQGNADFAKTFQALKDLNYQGDFTLQVARGEEGQEVETAKKHFDLLKNLLNDYFIK